MEIDEGGFSDGINGILCYEFARSWFDFAEETHTKKIVWSFDLSQVSVDSLIVSKQFFTTKQFIHRLKNNILWLYRVSLPNKLKWIHPKGMAGNCETQFLTDSQKSSRKLDSGQKIYYDCSIQVLSKR